MGKRLAEPDYELVAAVLSSEDREVVSRWCETLGVPSERWHRVPPLRQMVTMLALLQLAAGMPDISRGDAFAESCRALGLGDDCGRSTRPSDSYVRTLARWLGAAHGQNVRSAADEAA